MPAHLAANFEPVEPWHEPIQERQPRTIFAGQTFQSHAPVLDGNNFITGVLQRFLQKTPRDGVIVGNEDSPCQCFRPNLDLSCMPISKGSRDVRRW